MLFVGLPRIKSRVGTNLQFNAGGASLGLEPGKPNSQMAHFAAAVAICALEPMFASRNASTLSNNSAMFFSS